jgi:hypothetical protein
MGRVWVLDKDMNGTGAQMLPLDSKLREPEPKSQLDWVAPKRKPRVPKAPEPRPPRRFKIVDVMTNEVRAQDVDARATVDLLKTVHRMADVQVHVWEHDAERWRLLTLGEQRTLWALRER